MKRHVLNSLTTVSLLLCVAVVALWVRSYRGTDLIHYGRGRAGSGSEGRIDFVIEFGAGNCSASLTKNTILLLRPELPMEPGWSWHRHPVGDPAMRQGLGTSIWNRFGFGYDYAESDFDKQYRFWDVVFPLWLVAIVFAAPSAPRTWGLVRKFRRARNGICPACGYNLTGNVSGVCPECGRAK